MNIISFIKTMNSIFFTWSLLFICIPLGLMLGISFFSTSSKHLYTLPITLSNYLGLLNPIIVQIFMKSFLLATLTTLICLSLALPFSYLINISAHQQLFFILAIIPFWVSSLVRTYAIQNVLKTHGLLNKLLLKAHLIQKPLELLYTNSAVIIGMVYNLLPFTILPLYLSFEKFNYQLIEVANDLNASSWQKFRYILLPYSKKSLFSATIITFLPAMTLFYIPNILGGAKSMLLGNLIESLFLYSQNWPQGSAISTILSFFAFGILKLSKKRVKA